MRFEILKNGKVVDVRDFGEGSHKIGRVHGCDLVLPSNRISKEHAMIVIKGNKAAIVDLGSANGVFVNGVLVRKQRIRKHDEVHIADYQIRIARSQSGDMPRPQPARIEATDGNLAISSDTDPGFHPAEEEAAPEMAPQEKLLVLMDQKVLSPLYGLAQSFDWRIVLFGILGVTLLLSVLATVVSVLPWGQEIATREALKRAHTVLGQLVRENYRILSKTNDYTRLTVEAGEGEPGILSVSIIDPKANTILAPTNLFNKSVSNVHYLLAIQRVQEGKEFVDIPKGGSRYVVAQPISMVARDAVNKTVVAIVLADFETSKAIQAVYEPVVRSTLFAVLLILFSFYLISKMVAYPIIKMNEQLDSALKGDSVTIGSESKFPELEGLATSINFALSRIQQNSSESLVQDDSEERLQRYLRSIEEVDNTTSDGIILLDPDKKVLFVGQVFEKLLNVEGRYAVGQSVAEAIKEASVAGTLIDLVDNVVQSLGEKQSAELDIFGVLRQVGAVAHRGAEGSIECVLVMVKVNE